MVLQLWTFKINIRVVEYSYIWKFIKLSLISSIDQKTDQLFISLLSPTNMVEVSTFFD